jgi:hypothetical protein
MSGHPDRDMRGGMAHSGRGLRVDANGEQWLQASDLQSTVDIVNLAAKTNEDRPQGQLAQSVCR